MVCWWEASKRSRRQLDSLSLSLSITTSTTSDYFAPTRYRTTSFLPSLKRFFGEMKMVTRRGERVTNLFPSTLIITTGQMVSCVCLIFGPSQARQLTLFQHSTTTTGFLFCLKKKKRFFFFQEGFVTPYVERWHVTRSYPFGTHLCSIYSMER